MNLLVHFTTYFVFEALQIQKKYIYELTKIVEEKFI